MAPCQGRCSCFCQMEGSPVLALLFSDLMGSVEPWVQRHQPWERQSVSPPHALVWLRHFKPMRKCWGSWGRSWQTCYKMLLWKFVPHIPKATVSVCLFAKPFNLIHLSTFDHTVNLLPCLCFCVSLFLEKVKKKNKREREKKRSLLTKHLLFEVPSSLSLLEGGVMAEPPPSHECDQH